MPNLHKSKTFEFTLSVRGVVGRSTRPPVIWHPTMICEFLAVLLLHGPIIKCSTYTKEKLLNPPCQWEGQYEDPQDLPWYDIQQWYVDTWLQRQQNLTYTPYIISQWPRASNTTKPHLRIVKVYLYICTQVLVTYVPVHVTKGQLGIHLQSIQLWIFQYRFSNHSKNVRNIHLDFSHWNAF